MRACIFIDNLAVLINGCLTQEINIQKGLKQGNPIDPFIFLLGAKGLAVYFRGHGRSVFTMGLGLAHPS